MGKEEGFVPSPGLAGLFGGGTTEPEETEAPQELSDMDTGVIQDGVFLRCFDLEVEQEYVVRASLVVELEVPVPDEQTDEEVVRLAKTVIRVDHPDYDETLPLVVSAGMANVMEAVRLGLLAERQ